MNIVEKKCWPKYFQQIVDGKKTFDLRINDFHINEGDILLLREWDPKTKDYTGCKLEKIVGYVGKWKIEDLAKFGSMEQMQKEGILVISLKNK